MAFVFFDSSALVRRYDASEPGSARVRAICLRATGNVLLLIHIASVELASAFARKSRDGTISFAQMDRFWRQFRYHARYQYRINELDDDTYRRAERLVLRYPLRAADALHVAGAIEAQRALRLLGVDFVFCTADERQRRAAEAEQLAVEFVA